MNSNATNIGNSVKKILISFAMLLKFRNSANFGATFLIYNAFNMGGFLTFLLLSTPSSMAMLMPVGLGFPCLMLGALGTTLLSFHQLDTQKNGASSRRDFSVHCFLFIPGKPGCTLLACLLLLWIAFIHHYDVDDRRCYWLNEIKTGKRREGILVHIYWMSPICHCRRLSGNHYRSGLNSGFSHRPTRAVDGLLAFFCFFPMAGTYRDVDCGSYNITEERANVISAQLRKTERKQQRKIFWTVLLIVFGWRHKNKN